MPTAAPIDLDLDLNTASHLHRTDPAVSTIDLAPWLTTATDATAINGHLPQVLALTTQHWNTATIPTAGLHTCINALANFFEVLLSEGITTLEAITDTHIKEFIDNAPHLDGPPNTINNPIRHLRRNVVAALSTTAEAYGHAPLSIPAITAAKTTRPSTHDEVLLLRLTAGLIRSQRIPGLAAATLAALSSGATAQEAACIQPAHITATELILPGLTATTPGKVIEARTVPLDPWATHALRLFLERGYDGHSPRVLYTGRQNPLGNSAQVSITAQLDRISARAGLKQAGITPTAVRMWAALRENTDASTFAEAARRYGTHWTTLHHHVFRTQDRRLSSRAA